MQNPTNPTRSNKHTTTLTAALLLAAAALLFNTTTRTSTAADPDPSLFSDSTIDLGIVVRNLEASLAFYTNAIGFNNSSSFNVDGPYAKQAGLTTGHPLAIQVLTLNNAPTATQIKLMQVPDGTLPNHDTIHSTYGYSYITINVTSMNKSIARAQAEGATPIKPVTEIPNANGLMLALFHDPDGNIVELVGPR